MTTEELWRIAIVNEAREWIGTPYHIGGRVKGVGCDCATFILQVMVNVGVFTNERLNQYSPNWWLHTSEERYKFAVLRHARKIVNAICRGTQDIKPGNIILAKVGGSKVLNHGAIVVEWPNVIHSIHPKVMMVNATAYPTWSYRPIEVFDPL
jgi:cell wall-associated NlpC family hydrolase